MAADIDIPPIYDAITRYHRDYLADIWVGWLSTFYQSLIGYISQNGIFLPQLTTAQRDAIDTPQNGQMIYNTSIGSAQYFKAGTWTSF